MLLPEGGYFNITWVQLRWLRVNHYYFERLEEPGSLPIPGLDPGITESRKSPQHMSFSGI